MIDKDLLDLIERIILKNTTWLRHYIGQVKDVNDPSGKARVNVIVYDLGFNTSDIGFWCWPRDKNALTTPKVGDWVEIYFMNGDRNRPVYIGCANEMTDMLPANYVDKDSHIVFEDPDNKIKIGYKGDEDILEIGKNNFKEAARKGDKTLSNSSTDAAFFNYLKDIETKFNAHTHGGVTPGGGFTLVPAAPISTAPTKQDGIINEGSSQVKIGDK